MRTDYTERTRRAFSRCRTMIGGLLMLLTAACSDEDTPQTASSTEWNTYKVAVVMPLSTTDGSHWKQTAQWLQENLEEAQTGMETGVKLELEWYDENTADLSRLGTELAAREELAAVVGPFHNDHLDALGYPCAKTRKPLLVPQVTSEDIIRRYTTAGNVWSLTETDISQCELLLLRAQELGADTVSLLATDDAYGKTFCDWFAFQATELGMTPGMTLTYPPDRREEAVRQALSQSNDVFLLCALSSTDDCRRVLEEYVRRLSNNEDCPWIRFSGSAMSNELLKDNPSSYLLSGLAPYADPASGFTIAYGTRFGTPHLPAEAQFYDALLLTAIALTDYQTHYSSLALADGVNGALRRILTASSSSRPIAWESIGLRRQLEDIQAGKYAPFIGASGPLAFDSSSLTSIRNSCYVNWSADADQFISFGFASSTGTNRISSSVAAWEWRKTVEEIFEDKPTGISYPRLNDQWALLVAASEQWSDYRFQADVLDFYQLLRRNGIDDDHIVLILENDLADNDRNPYPGIIQSEKDGADLNQDVRLDYQLHTLQPADIVDILNGRKSDRLPHVIESGSADNVLVFWSGHGTPGQFVWCKDRPEFTRNGFTRALFQQAVEEMAAAGRYRKLLWLAETCYSASVTSACEGIPGVMAIAAAQAQETSKATGWDGDRGIYLSNVFTRNLMNAVKENPNVSFHALYNALNRNTTASHVEVSNNALFDNLYRSSIYEFIHKE